ncbi:MAG: DNA topoisomerase VI subunit B [Planctomycetes bacterium]|nr:DNA topoisomerase VI subunit B [Planctomycetota bacterium]
MAKKKTASKKSPASAKSAGSSGQKGLFDDVSGGKLKPKKQTPKIADSPKVSPSGKAAEKPAAKAVEPETVESDAEATSPAAKSAAGKKSRAAYATAETMAKAQRSISVSEFFAKNRHLLGFDNPRKALLTTVKEAVDNSLDACEEAGILPAVEIAIRQITETHFCVSVQDNGPGIVRQQIPNIFGRLLYGSKFHRLRMSRGQQGIGISAAGMYGLLTTGKPIRITSRTSPKAQAHYYELQIDTRKNLPDIMKDDKIDWDAPHGTKVEIELEAKYLKGKQSVDDYLQQTAIANPHVTLVYHAPDGRNETYSASVSSSPPLPKEVRPHPLGVELGVMIKMLQDTRAKTAQQFLTSEFSRVSPRVAKEILDKAGIDSTTRVSRLTAENAKAVYHAVQQTKIMAPSTDSVVPIGEEQLISGLKQVVQADFYAAVSRSPAVYRGNPFIIEAAIAYGKPGDGEADSAEAPAEQKQTQQLIDGLMPHPAGEAQMDDDEDDSELARVIRFANRVPLLYQQGACAIYKAVTGMNWRAYGLIQGRGALPCGNLVIAVHMASVWVPFTSESKEAIAQYPEIMKELKLALQECGRQLGAHVRKTARINTELKKRSYIEKYLPAIGEALRDILDLKEKQVDKVCKDLKKILEHSRKF